MREIRFRGKRLDTGEWVEGFYSPVKLPIFGEMGHFINEGGYKAVEIDPATVGQFIDREDLHGSRIFEGDIVDHGRGRFVVRYIKSISRFAGTKPGISFAGFSFENSVKVGNIYDNPELLEVSGDG